MTDLSFPDETPSPSRSLLRAVLIGLAIFLLYAFAVQFTEISLEEPLDPGNQERVVRVLRLLADPDILEIENGQVVGLSEATRITIERIIETIFMALMASTIGTVLAVPASFIAARNLMEPVTAPLAAIMAAVLALPIGGWVGSRVSRLVMDGAAQLSDQLWLVALLFLAAVGAAWWFYRTGMKALADKARTRRVDVMLIGRFLLALLLTFVALSLFAQLGVDVGRWLQPRLGPFAFLGNFIRVASDFVRLGLPAFIGLLGALVAMSYGSRYGQEAVLRLEGWPARLLTGALATLGMAIVVFGIGSFLNWLYLFDNPENWTTIPAAAVGGLGLVVGLAAAPKRPYPIGYAIYSVSRGLLNVLRSIEPLIMGIVFVVWVSLGPFAGVMALTLHSIAALGKLFSEQVEGIDDGPIEAVLATGASRLQMIVYAVIPQIVPPFIAFTLYRWDINVRMSTIIGFVGGGGIGFVLSQNIQQLRYRQASVMMIAIAIVVSTLDYVSSKVRARII